MADQSSNSSSAGDAPQSSDSEGQSSYKSSSAEKRGFLSGIFPFLRGRQQGSLRENLEDALSESAESDSTFSPEERSMLNNILRLREVRVEDVMIPRSEIEAVEISTPLGELLERFEDSGHSRMPVYAETLDDPRGMIHIRDVLNYITRQARQKSSEDEKRALRFDNDHIDLDAPIGELGLVRKVLFVPPSMLAGALMARMQANRIQMALVIDEYGGTDGLASLEDVIEMVFGDIEDEHDDEEVMIAPDGKGGFIVDARMELEELAEKVDPSFEQGEFGDEVDTVGGLIFSMLDHFPVAGEIVHAVPGYEFEVLEVDHRRILKVRITPVVSNNMAANSVSQKDAGADVSIAG